MDDSGTHTRHEPGLGPSAREPKDQVRAGRDTVTLKAQWRTGPRTRAWDEMWRWLLDGLDNTAAADRGPDDDDMSLGAPPSPGDPD